MYEKMLKRDKNFVLSNIQEKKVREFVNVMKKYNWYSKIPVVFDFVDFFFVDNKIDRNILGTVSVDSVDHKIVVSFSFLTNFAEIQNVVQHEYCHFQQINALLDIGGFDFVIAARNWEFNQFGEESLSEAYATELKDVDDFYVDFFTRFKSEILCEKSCDII